ncbi:IclR family transcriptional regulator [Nonomuraea sp. NBC_00507]|uniref:IclR family transcriptional regulator n=1 Tax=Nonomuraea sp. NBC_00507 TaxID=2976002 RepID=UPI003FA58834
MTLELVAIGSFDLGELARPTLVGLQGTLNETVNMAIPDGHDVVYVIRVRGPGPLDIRLQVGSRLPAFCTSLGRVMLAHLPTDELDAFLATAGLTAKTERTVTDPKRLRSTIATIRKRATPSTTVNSPTAWEAWPSGRPARPPRSTWQSPARSRPARSMSVRLPCLLRPPDGSGSSSPHHPGPESNKVRSQEVTCRRQTSP